MENPSASLHGSQRWLERSVELISLAVAVCLMLSAVALLLSALVHFLMSVPAEGVMSAGLRLIEELLLVIMLAEIVHTVGISIQKGTLACEPFLVVGVISAIRRMLIITAEAANPSDMEEGLFELMMTELGILTLMIVALTFGIFLLRRRPAGS